MRYSRQEIIEMLSLEGAQREQLFADAKKARDNVVGSGIYLRGLIEYSNVCAKDCHYCGIRRSQDVPRYTLSATQVIEAAEFALESRYGSIVIQGGEVTSPKHVETIEQIVREIKQLSGGNLGITLSMGEQTKETYDRWFEAGAHRYLLRIETSNEDLYRRLHPCDGDHQFGKRLESLRLLRECGYQVGSGTMVGLPGQSVGDMADDLLFLQSIDIDMCGMGPYIVSDGTPLALSGGQLWPETKRFDMTLKMIAALRLMMPDINIAASTALQAIDPEGRLKAIECGANVIMPNISPQQTKSAYKLYNNKPLFFDSTIIEDRVKWGEWGDSQHFRNCLNFIQ